MYFLDWFDGMTKGKKVPGTAVKYSSDLNIVMKSQANDYNTFCQIVAMKTFPVLTGMEKANNSCSMPAKPAEQILQEIICCAYCIENSFYKNKSVDPQGNVFLKQVIV